MWSWIEMQLTKNGRIDGHWVAAKTDTRHPRCEIRKNFFSSRVIDKWNFLPSDLKNSVTVMSFKKKYITY